MVRVMPKLKAIDGIKIEKPDYHSIYRRAFINALKNVVDVCAGKGKEEFGDVDLDDRKKIIWLGVKVIGGDRTENPPYDLLVNRFRLISHIQALMGTLTPREFQTIFPIDKEYDGEKYEMKDYFYTKKYIAEFGENKVIGEEISEFLWEYQNRTTCEFVIKTLSTMSAIRRAEGQKGLAEEFFEERGVTTYTLTKDGKGNKFLTNNDTGEVEKVKKPVPRYMTVVK